MANAEEQRRLDDLISDVNFPMPEADDLDLDFDFDFSAKDVTNAGTGLPAVPDEYMLDHQYGAVAALATQASWSSWELRLFRCVHICLYFLYLMMAEIPWQYPCMQNKEVTEVLCRVLLYGLSAM